MPDLDFRVELLDPRRLHDLRRRILRANLPEASVADERDDEEGARHYAGLVGERVVVSATFYVSVSPVHPDRVARQLRYMASDEDVRGRGYGRRVLEFAAHDLAALGVEELWANARDTALGFYRATGWEEVAGTQHLSTLSGIPHTVIVRRLVT